MQMVIASQNFLMVFCTENLSQGSNKLLEQRDRKICSANLIGKESFLFQKLTILFTLYSVKRESKLVSFLYCWQNQIIFLKLAEYLDLCIENFDHFFADFTHKGLDYCFCLSQEFHCFFCLSSLQLNIANNNKWVN